MGTTRKEYEIWSEGYAATGEHGAAQFVGTVSVPKGTSFEEACRKFFKEHPRGDYDPETNRVWGCRLFENEGGARWRFG